DAKAKAEADAKAKAEADAKAKAEADAKAKDQSEKQAVDRFQKIIGKSPGTRRVDSVLTLIDAESTSGLPLIVKSLTPEVCVPYPSIFPILQTIKIGECRFQLLQEGNVYWDAAQPLSLSFIVAPPRMVITIKCTKGTNSIIISGTSPVCPKGFTKKD
ncbi:MAG: hypothetical protein EB045_01120, partial [Actinobacteria bacterium]|nr:hypothetical protein [Actinomycetota bacterium]